MAAMSVYGGVTAADREARRRARLIAAALDLLGDPAPAAVTVRAVCARARLTPRYFYESFGDLDALLVAVFDAVAEEAAIAVVEAADAAPEEAGAKARAAIGAFIALVVEDPRRARILFVEGIASAALARRRFETLRLFADLVAAQGRAFYGLPPRQDALLRTTALMLVGGLAETLLAWLDGSLETSAERLVEDCSELFVASGQAAVELARARAATL
jgi:AcrR family transcriptional regulator